MKHRIPERPGGRFRVTQSNASLTDCPKCRYGTLMPEDAASWACIDCGASYTLQQLDYLGIRKLRK